jgi:hypothetical protein
MHCQANKKAHATREWVLFFRYWQAGPAQQQKEREVREQLLGMLSRLSEEQQQILATRIQLGG